MTPPETRRHGFAIDPRHRRILRLFGVRGEQDAFVDLDDDTFTVRFGYWAMRTPVTNLAGAQSAGPFTALKVLGPHLSFADRGVTFGSNADRGVCVQFHRPVPGLEPLGLLRHPAVTVTVTDPTALIRSVTRRSATPDTT